MNGRRPRMKADEEVLEPLPASAAEAPKAMSSVWGLFEILLKAPGRLDPFIRVPDLQTRLSVGMAVITAVGMALYALGLFMVMKFSPASALPEVVVPGWDGGIRAVVGLQAAYPVGILLATLIVLPSYWFVGMLMGVKMPVSEVLTHSLKGKAATTVLVLGLLPIYGVVLTCLILAQAPDVMIKALLWLGLVLPYIAALRGAGAIEAGFRNVVATTPDLSRGRRYTIPTSLMLLWAVLFTLVVPVVMYRAYEVTTHWLGAA